MLKWLLFMILLGCFSFRKKVRKLWKDFWITMEIFELYEKKFDEFRGGFEICPKSTAVADKILWSRLLGDMWLFDEDATLRGEWRHSS